MIERFSRAEFEAALALAVERGAAERWESAGRELGEEVYHLWVNENARVLVRSSIDASGVARDSGEDSIRILLQVRVGSGDRWQPQKKLDAYTTRVTGWEDRLYVKAQELAHQGRKIRRPIEPCRECGETKRMWFTASGRNVGRPAMKCFTCQEGFVWLDEENADDAKKSKPSSSAPATRPAPSVSRGGKADPTDASGNAERAAASSIGSAPNSISPPESVKPVAGDPDPSTDLNDLFDEIAQVVASAEEKLVVVERPPSEQQGYAIHATIDNPARLISGAGSGKTFVLERRYRYLLQQGLKPDQIVVVTFTKAMSSDMAERIISLNPSISGTAGESQICSIHAFCNRVLQLEGLARRIPEKEWEVRKILKDLVKKLWPLTNGRDPSTARPTWEELYSVIASAKAHAIRPGSDLEWASALWGEYHGARLSEARRRYDAAMQENNWWNFIDMLYEMEIALQTRRGFVEKLRSRYHYCMVDEGQDTNHQAMRILTAIFGDQDRIFIVGDPDQLLFRFTGATPEANMYEGFSERYPNGNTFFMETNYRSTHAIVDASTRLIAHNYAVRGGPYGEEYRKTCRAAESAALGVPLAWSFWENQEEEAEAVTATVRELLDTRYRPGDIFVGARTRGQLGQLEPHLTEAGIPFINITGGSFWQIRHVAIVLNYLRLALNHDHSEAFARVYNIASENMTDRTGAYSPTRWLGQSFLRDVHGEYNRQTLEDSAGSYYSHRDGIRDLVGFMDDLEEVVRGQAPADAVRYVIDHCVARYLKEEEGLQDDDNGIGKLADLEVVADLAGKFDSLEKFFERVDAAIKAAQDAKSKNWGEYVVLSTVHRLKGMERPVVIGVGWCENQEEKTGLLPHTYSLQPPPTNGVLGLGGGQGRVEDERCIAYVLITRAKQEVYLSGFRQFRKTMLQPSRFAVELGLAVSSVVERNPYDDDKRDDAW
jgi:DNA helicase II / ATP-dependent DNA helicase PcrA